MDKEFKLDAGDEAELVNTCKQVYQDEKNKGLRLIQKLTKKISNAFK